MNPSILLQAPIAGCMRWGAWGAGFSKAEYRDMIDQCLELGIQSFDHADIYGDYTTEEEFGEVLKEDKTLRSRLKLITKCGIKMVSENRPDHQVKSYHTGRKHILQSVEQSLKHFGTDYLDVLLIHRPDPLLNPTEVAEAIQVLQQQGKVLAFGVSNFMPHQAEVLRQWVPLSYH
ncbi:MAG: oxidoreductase, partial [Sphingobacteriia bacterium]